MTTTTASFAHYTIRSILETNEISIIAPFCLELSKPSGYTLLIHSIPDIFNNPTNKLTLEDQLGKTWLLSKPDACAHKISSFQRLRAQCRSIDDVLSSVSYKDYLKEARKVFETDGSEPILHVIGSWNKKIYVSLEEQRRSYQDP